MARFEAAQASGLEGTRDEFPFAAAAQVSCSKTTLELFDLASALSENRVPLFGPML